MFIPLQLHILRLGNPFRKKNYTVASLIKMREVPPFVEVETF